MHKLVLDTNVIVSSCISEHAPPGKIIDQLFLEDKIVICLSADVLAEYTEVLNRDKFLHIKGFSQNAQKFLQYVAEFGLWFEPTVVFTQSPDVDDNIFLDLAFAATANFIVTGNLKHFPNPDFRGIQVVSPADYWNFSGNQACSPSTKHKMSVRLLAAALLLLAAALPAQQPLEFTPAFRNYTTDDGLPNNWVYDIYQDKTGYIWIATDHGVCRFNGYTFEQFPDTLYTNLTSVMNGAMAEDSLGRLWYVDFQSRVFYIENGIIHPYAYNHVIVEQKGRADLFSTV